MVELLQGLFADALSSLVVHKFHVSPLGSVSALRVYAPPTPLQRACFGNQQTSTTAEQQTVSCTTEVSKQRSSLGV